MNLTSTKVIEIAAGTEGAQVGPYRIDTFLGAIIDTGGAPLSGPVTCGHLRNCDPNTIKELCRLALIGIEAERLRANDTAGEDDGWMPIETADRSIAVVMDFGGVVLRHSYPIWARTDGGTPREVSWAARGAESADDGYWWDWDAEDVVSPDQWLPHPLDRSPHAVDQEASK